MLAYLWSAVTWAVVGISGAAHAFGCGFHHCVHFLDHDFTPIVYTLDKDGLRSYAIATAYATISRDHLPRLIVGAINAAPIFVSELTQTEPFPMDLLTDADHRELRPAMSPPAWRRLVALLPDLERTPPTVRPMVVYRMFTEKIMSELVGTPASSDLLEVQLAHYARGRGKDVRALDHLRDVVATLGDAISSALLEWTVTNLDPSVLASAFEAQRAAFRRGDADQFADLVARAHADLRTEILYERLVVARNRRWVPRLVALHDEGPFALMISASHLGGPDGLVSLLGDAGFRVRRVRPAPP